MRRKKKVRVDEKVPPTGKGGISTKTGSISWTKHCAPRERSLCGGGGN